MGYARRRLFVDGSKDTEDDLLVLFPEDGATAQRFDAGGPVHLVWGPPASGSPGRRP